MRVNVIQRRLYLVFIVFIIERTAESRRLDEWNGCTNMNRFALHSR